MSFIEEVRNTTKMAEEKALIRGTKLIIKETKKKIRKRAMMGKYNATYYIPTGTRFYKSEIEEYFAKEGFDCTIISAFGADSRVMVYWKEEK